MKIKTSIASLATAGLIAASSLVMLNAVSASATTTTAAEITIANSDQAIIKTVDEAMQGLRQIHAARLAIFNGDTDVALKHVTAAEMDFRVIEQAINTHQVAITTPNSKADAYIPFDMTIGLAEDFVPTEEMAGKLREAGQQFDQGNHKNAIEVLRQAKIDVTVSAGLLPARASLVHVQDAIKLIDAKKYYEANLALKALEDSVVFESYSADTVPAQASKS